MMDPEQLSETAREHYARRQYREAARLFAEAAEAYGERGAVLNAAEARNNQCVALLKAKRPEGALAAVTGTAELFAAAGDRRRQGLALANQASALEALKRYPEALTLYRQAADWLEQVGEDQARADVLGAVAELNARLGRLTDMIYDEQDALLGVKKPTFRQRLLRTLMLHVLWRKRR